MIKKAFLYCTKLKPYLLDLRIMGLGFQCLPCDSIVDLNGKIVAECDFEVEEIHFLFNEDEELKKNNGWRNYRYAIESLNYGEFYKKSCLSFGKLDDYFGAPNENKKVGYAIQIENLTIFDEPMKLSDLMQDVPRYETGGHVFANEDEKWINIGDGPFAILVKKIKKAPQNMMYCYYFNKETNMWEKAVLISIRPEWMAEIMNGYKTYEIRRKVLKEMIK